MNTNNGTRTSRPSKKDIKYDKAHLKNPVESSYYLRKVTHQLIKQTESQPKFPEDDKADILYYQDPIFRRAIHVWNRIDKEYFRNVNQLDIAKRRIACAFDKLRMGDEDIMYFSDYRTQIGLGNELHSPKIRVLFKNKQKKQSALAIYQIQSAIPSFSTENEEGLEQSIKIHLTRTTKPKSQMNQSNLQIKSIRLDLEQIQTNQKYCQKNTIYSNEIDKEIAMWEWQLNKVSQNNEKDWTKIVKSLKNKQNSRQIVEIDHFNVQVSAYRDKLYWNTVLRSFEHGFKDKTKKMFDAYIESQKLFSKKSSKGIQGINHKKMFETDCKICFSSDNNDSNQVLYCDSCNTSFHLACYGLTAVPEEQTYFCERCTYIKKEQQQNSGVKYKKLYCQICLKNSFPMKNLDEHFYHVTCLVLFNFVEFRGNKMVLRGSLSHENILKMVIENQITHEECSQCAKMGGGTQLGMQIKCGYQGCEISCHPICAYLSGYKFELKVSRQKHLNIKMFCNSHLGSRVEQVYIRRYMCNLNETSSKLLAQVKKVFENQQQVIQKFKQNSNRLKKRYPNRILIMTRFIKNLLKSRSDKNKQDIETETQAIIRKLKQKKDSR